MKVFRIVLTGEEPPHFTITNAFKKKFDVVDTLYWDEFTDNKYLNEVIQARVKAHKYDIVFMQIQGANIIKKETAKVLSEHALVFNWTGDVRNNIDWYLEIGEYVVTLFTNMNDIEKMRKLGYRSDYLQTGYDTEYYFNTNKPRLNNIAFCANYYSRMNFPLTQYRADAIQFLKENLPENFNLYGQNWDILDLKAEGIADNQHEALLYNATSLALSISHYNYSRYFSDRLLREMACGCCVLSHRYKDCEKDFSDGENIVFWDNYQDMLSKAKYLFDNPQKAREIGNNAAKFVAENYNWEVVLDRFKLLINKYQK